MKKEINILENATQIMEAVNKGVLLTTCADGEVNTMAISWGMLGIEWKKPLFVTFVRQSRHTKTLLDKNPEFTINVPLGKIDKTVLSVTGTESGRDVNKIEKLNLTLVPGDTVSVPAIAELPLTLECKVVYQQDQVLSLLEQEKRNRFYAPGTANENDFHTAYYGEITAAYIIKE